MNRPDPFSVQVVTEEGSAAVIVSGDVDVDSEEQLVAAIQTAVLAVGAHGPSQGVVMDLGEVVFMDSSGLRAVLRSREIAAAAGVALRLVVPTGPVTRLFATAGVIDRFEYERRGEDRSRPAHHP